MHAPILVLLLLEWVRSATDPVRTQASSGAAARVARTALSLALNRWVEIAVVRRFPPAHCIPKKGRCSGQAMGVSGAERVSETLRHRRKARAVVVEVPETTS